jgi:hypothetical protein
MTPLPTPSTSTSAAKVEANGDIDVITLDDEISSAQAALDACWSACGVTSGPGVGRGFPLRPRFAARPRPSPYGIFSPRSPEYHSPKTSSDESSSTTRIRLPTRRAPSAFQFADAPNSRPSPFISASTSTTHPIPPAAPAAAATSHFSPIPNPDNYNEGTYGGWELKLPNGLNMCNEPNLVEIHCGACTYCKMNNVKFFHSVIKVYNHYNIPYRYWGQCLKKYLSSRALTWFYSNYGANALPDFNCLMCQFLRSFNPRPLN